MGYFNINSILYNIRKILKYFSIISFIVLSLFFLLIISGREVKAAICYPENGGVSDISDNMLAKAIEFFNNSNYDSYFVIRGGSNEFGIVLFNNVEGNMFYSNTSYPSTSSFWLKCTYQDNITTDYYSMTESNGSVNFSFVSSALKFGQGNYRYSVKGVYSGNNTIYYSDGVHILMPDNYIDNFETPYISMPNDNTDTYINGEFSDFLVVRGNDVDFLSFFYADLNDEVSENSGVVLTLDENSPYYLSNYNENNIFVIPKTVIPYLDGHEYGIKLQYLYDNVTYSSDMITWTTDFSDQAILNDDIRARSITNQQLDDLYQSQRDISSFLTGSNYNSDDIKMPELDINFEQEGFLDDVFSKIRNVFVGNNYTDIVIPFPFSDESIIINSDYVESHVPSFLINLIRLFYWFIISRFIFKDVFAYIDSLRQGDFFMSSESDIKTEVL